MDSRICTVLKGKVHFPRNTTELKIVWTHFTWLDYDARNLAMYVEGPAGTTMGVRGGKKMK